MPSTPRPARRIRTPPTPLHGPRYDSYEPYSPRRSARVSAQRDHLLSSPEISSSHAKTSQRSHLSHASDTTPRKSSAEPFVSSQTLSPPTSPELPAVRDTPTRFDTSLLLKAYGHSTPRRKLAPSSHSFGGETRGPVGEEQERDSLLPTPVKTPNKRTPNAATSAARILNFRPSDSEMLPTPRKQRRSRLTLDSPHETRASVVEVYTDSQNRVPAMDGVDEENPFVGPRKKDSARSGRRAGGSSARAMANEEMEEAVRNNEGIIYVFRGRKILRRFDDPHADFDDDMGPGEVFDLESRIRRSAGAAAQRPFTRSSLKPRLLFPSAEHQGRHDTAHEEDDEEADTDIEVEEAPKTPPKQVKIASHKHDNHMDHEGLPATPPSVMLASSKRKTVRIASPLPDPTTETPSLDQPKPKKVSPFDKWQRTKPGSVTSGVQSKKRSGSPTIDEESAGGKRTRSSAH